jgi:hypothetical protein
MTNTLGDTRKGKFDANLAERVNQELDRIAPPEKKGSRMLTINPKPVYAHEYYLIEGMQIGIAKDMTHKDLTWNSTFEALEKEALMMPDISNFMRHLHQVHMAYIKRGQLHYLNGDKIPREEVIARWMQLFSTHRESVSECITWLDGRFLDVKIGQATLYENHIISCGEYHAAFKSQVTLCLSQDIHYLRINSENNRGLPVHPHTLNQPLVQRNAYVPGENLKYQPPTRDGQVALYTVDSLGARLICDAAPNSNHGVLACASIHHLQKEAS